MPSEFSGTYPNQTSLGLVFQRLDGWFYNTVTTGWDDLSQSGFLPGVAHVTKLDRPATSGPTQYNFYAQIPDIASNVSCVTALTFVLDKTGKPGDQIDSIPALYIGVNQAGRGGFRRFS